MIDSVELEKASRKELIELLDITQKWSTPVEGKFSIYEPNPVMWGFHQSPAKTRVIGGGNRSGKSFCEMIDVAAQFKGYAPKSLVGLIPEYRLDPCRRIRFCTVDYPNNFIKVIWPLVQQTIKPAEIADVIKDSGRIRAITNRKGGFIEFMMYESEVNKFQGSSRHCIVYDEEPPQEIRDENLMRLVDTDGDEVFAMTPIDEANYGQSSSWVYDELFLKAGKIVEKSEGQLIVKENPEGDSNVHFFFANIYDNQAIRKEAADRILAKFTKEEREAREKGHFMFLSGLIYKSYSDDIHVIEEFNSWYLGRNKDDYTLYIAIDPHPRTPHAVLFLVARRDGLLFIVDEIFNETNSAKELVELIQMKQNGKPANVIIIDPLAYTKDPSTGSTLAFDLADAGLYPIPIPASKDKARGIMLVKSLLKDENGKVGLYITRNCTRFRYEITHWRWDTWKKSTANVRGEKQKPIDKDDHFMENLYRVCLLNPRWVPILDEEEEDVRGLHNG